MQNPVWLLIIAGILMTVIGLGWLLFPSIPWFGKLPGDLVVERDQFRFYFPIVTCILLSALFTGIMWLARFFGK